MTNIPRIAFLICFLALSRNSSAQSAYGKTLNLGAGIGYYGYLNHSIPVLHLNYEFDVAKDVTLAPFISFYSYRNDYYWGNKNYPYRYYRYNETVIPIGIKGSYYFDRAVHAGNKWDFYFAASLGFAVVRSGWEDGYYGDRNLYRNAYRGSSPLYLDLHLGADYHVNKSLGVFLDLSSGVSTLGLSIKP